MTSKDLWLIGLSVAMPVIGGLFLLAISRFYNWKGAASTVALICAVALLAALVGVGVSLVWLAYCL